MSRDEPVMCEKMKKALLHWFNTVGSQGCNGERVELLSDLWKEHVPALLLYLKTECKSENLALGARGTSALAVYEDATEFMKSSTESQHMAAYLSAGDAANGNDIEIAKFLLLLWHELCISDKKTIEISIPFMDQEGLQNTMGNAIEWMNQATANQDYDTWYHVLFEGGEEVVENREEEPLPEATTPVDTQATTPIGDVSFERMGEQVFTATTPANIPMRHSLYENGSTRNSLMMTPRLSARRQLSIPSSEPRHFIVPHIPVSRGSPIAEQLNSPAMREKRRERELRSLRHNMAQVQEDRDAKEIEVNELRRKIDSLSESNHELKTKLGDKTRELTRESTLRDKMEEDLEKEIIEKKELQTRLNDILYRHKTLNTDCDRYQVDINRLSEKVAEMERKLTAKSRELVDVRDEVITRQKELDSTRDSIERLRKENEEILSELQTVKENGDEVKEDWRRRLKEKEDEMMQIMQYHDQSNANMNKTVMEKDMKIREITEELENERKRFDEVKKNADEEIGRMRDELGKKMEEMRVKKEKLDELEKERERMEKEMTDKARELTEKKNDIELELIDVGGMNISLKQSLSKITSERDAFSQEAMDMQAKMDKAMEVNNRLKETIREMDEDRKTKDEELSRLRNIQETNDQLTRELSTAKEKEYAAVLEHDRFTAQIAQMRQEMEAIEEDNDWITKQKEQAERAADNAEIELEKGMKSWEEERKSYEEKAREMEKKLADCENEIKRKNELEKELDGCRGSQKENEEMKEEMDRLKKECYHLKTTGQENMENVVAKKKEVEKELEKSLQIIDSLKEEMRCLKERQGESLSERVHLPHRGDENHELSMMTVKDDRRGSYTPHKVLMDFDEEPTLLYAKTNLSGMKEKQREDVMEVNNKENARIMGRISEDKENDSMFMMTPASDRRHIPSYESNKRLDDIANRNANTLPHMRSHYAVEQELSCDYSQEGLTHGVLRPQSAKKFSTTIKSRLGFNKK